MKNFRLLKLHVSLFCLFLFSCPFHTLAQLVQPIQWEAFINDPVQNVMVRDTFLFQSFENSLSDNWNYEQEKGELWDASAHGFTGQGGNFSLRIVGLKNELAFDEINPSIYEDVKAQFLFGTSALNMNNELAIKYQIKNDNQKKYKYLVKAKSSQPAFSYRTNTIVNNNEFINNPFVTVSGICQLTLMTSGDNSNSTYFIIDSVMAHGLVPSYSLFSGKGNWSDTTRWSHLPPARYRHALITGDVIIDDQIACNSISVNNGKIHVDDGAQLDINNLILFNENISFTSEGNIRLKDGITVCRTFEKTGQWYFISFPFDVHLEDIDPAFEFKDDTPNDGGNYFYVLFYDGERRSQTNSSSNNWKVLTESTLENNILFQKGKGYLFALDAAASTRTITFSSAPVEIVSNFGKTGKIPVKVSQASYDGNEHHGWYLCGNPFAAALSLSCFPDTPDLDGNIYVYNGKDYQAYEIGSNYKIPPFSAFFVKAKNETELAFSNSKGNTSDQMINMSSPFTGNNTEPDSKDNSTQIEELSLTRNYLTGNMLYIEHLVHNGSVSVYDLNGKKIFQKPVTAGNSSTRLPLSNGIYIIHIESPTYRTQFKCVINQ